MTIAEIHSLAEREGILIEILNLGGGFPSRLNKEVPSFNSIKENINRTIHETFSKNDLQFYIEPGRGIVGESAIYIASIIAKADRGLDHWISLDIGVYNGLLEAVAGIQYEIVTHNEYRKGLERAFLKESHPEIMHFNITGPTCDSWDTIAKNYPMLNHLNIGDIVYILNVGAYTLSGVTNFNGFGAPEIYFV